MALVFLIRLELTIGNCLNRWLMKTVGYLTNAVFVVLNVRKRERDVNLCINYFIVNIVYQ
jgi:hypothetical protein